MEESNIFSSKSYNRASTNLRSKLKTSFLKVYPHFAIPGCNLHAESSVEQWDIENIVEQYQEFAYHCDLPKPLLPPARLPRTVIHEEDPALQLLSLKAHLKDDMDRIKNYYQRHAKDFDVVHQRKVKWNKIKNKMTTSVPRYLADLAEMIEIDPDPYFNGVYNWYFTGGTLDNIMFNNTHILLFPFMEELVAVPIQNIEDFLWKPLLSNSAKCKLRDSIYELKHNTFGNMCLVLGRHKYHSNIYALRSRNNRYSLNEIHEQSSKIPLVGADLNSVDQNKYCLVDVERTVTLWDMTKMKCISKNSVISHKVLPDVWGSLRFQPMDPNTIIYTDRCCVHYLDTRIAFDDPVMTICPKNNLESCENLSLNIASRHNSCIYLGSCHSLLMCDDRSPKDCVQQKWTHQFKTVPLMGSVINRENEEIIVLSSQLAGESTIVINTWTTEKIPHSYNLPHSPPTITQSLNESQSQGLCLDPHLRTRFELSNVGSTLVNHCTGGVYTFSQNSIGDIYYQCITHESPLNKYSPINCKAICILNAWESAIFAGQETVTPLTISHKTNMEQVYQNFTNKRLVLQKTDQDTDDSFEPSWKQSLEKLGSYIDILAPELLAVWEMDEDATLPSSAPPYQKVLSWLETTATKTMNQTQEEIVDISTTVNTQELISVSQQEPDIVCVDDSNVLQELFLPKVRTKPIKKKKKIQK